MLAWTLQLTREGKGLYAYARCSGAKRGCHYQLSQACGPGCRLSWASVYYWRVRAGGRGCQRAGIVLNLFLPWAWCVSHLCWLLSAGNGVELRAIADLCY